MRKAEAVRYADEIQKCLNIAGYRNLIDVVDAKLDRLPRSPHVLEVRVHRPGARGEWAVHQTIDRASAAIELLVFVQAIEWGDKARRENLSFLPLPRLTVGDVLKFKE